MDDPLDECRLETIADLHGVSTGLFVPFAIERLRRGAEVTEAILELRLRRLGGAPEAIRGLRISWSREQAVEQPLAVQEHTVTEWATLGVACLIVWLYAGLRIRTVAAPGDRFD